MCCVVLCCAVFISCTKEETSNQVPEQFEVASFSEIDEESLITREDIGEIIGKEKQMASGDPGLE